MTEFQVRLSEVVFLDRHYFSPHLPPFLCPFAVAVIIVMLIDERCSRCTVEAAPEAGLQNVAG